MGLNYAKQRSRDLVRAASRAALDDALYLAECEHGLVPSKSALRAEGSAALAAYRRPVRIVPRVVKLRCGKCGHCGEVRLMPEVKAAKFRCKRCGTRQLLALAQ